MSNEGGLVEAEVKCRLLYKCVACGKNALGTTFYEPLSASIGMVDDLMKGFQQTSSRMPVGWNFNGKFNCGCSK